MSQHPQVSRQKIPKRQQSRLGFPLFISAFIAAAAALLGDFSEYHPRMTPPLGKETEAESKAWQYVKDMLDPQSYEQFRLKGWIDIKGNNRFTYRIFTDGCIESSSGKQGRLTASGYPLADVIATAIDRIRKDADGFEADWGCGIMRARR